jgi:putative ABC transport system permease protein
VAWLESIRIAFEGLTANRLRSALTTLGILIGVAAVILLVAVGNGASAAVQSSIDSLGTNLLLVQPGSTQGTGGVNTGAGGATSLTLADAQALGNKQLAPDVLVAAPSVNARVTAVYHSANWTPSSFVGTTPDYFTIRNYSLAEGAFFTNQQVTSAQRVVVIGQTVATSLFGQNDPVGQTILFNRIGYRVVGVLAPKGSNGTQNLDDVVMAPMTTVLNTISGRVPAATISVEATSAGSMAAAQAEVTQILLQQHKITNSAAADFTVQNQSQLVSARTQTTQVFTVLLGSVAAISLLVGGIGIMNIMLVTVTERTREIGIRKALGARRADILAQFLAESVLLAGIGGGLGVGVALLSASKLHDISVFSTFTPVIAQGSVYLAFGVAVAIGLFFGIFPANRAASLRPIEALRYE